jgi:peptidylprolyl isomerase
VTTARATRFLAVGLTGAALLFAGCGGDDDKSSETAAASTSTAADTTSSTAKTPEAAASTAIRNPFTNPARTPVHGAHRGARVDQLIVKDVKVGDGEELFAGDTATVDYYGTIYTTGRRFDSSWDRRESADFPIDRGGIIHGFFQGLQGMRVGGRRTIVIPSELGYGAQANGPIPANSTLAFTVDLLGVRKATPAGPAPEGQPAG